MKKILFTLFILTFFENANSQNLDNQLYFTGGYNFNFPNASSVNFIIDRYNDTRSYLTTKMDNINSMTGFDLSVGGVLNDMILEAGLTFKSSGVKYAEGTVSGIPYRRDFKVSNFFVDLGIGYLMESKSPVKFGFGLFTDIGSFTYKTRVYNVNETPPDYTDVTPTSSSLALGFTPTLFLNANFNDNIGISIRPYYLAQVFSQDLTDVNAALNPSTWQNDEPDEYDSETFSGFGVDLKAVISF